MAITTQTIQDGGVPKKTQRNILIIVTLGWVLDAFDYLMLTYIAIDIMKNFNVTAAVFGSVISVTVLARLFGGALGGVFADKWGRRIPLITSLLWYGIFQFITGLSPTFTLLYLFRFLFGLGMGSMYSIGVPLLMETVPSNRRGLASGLVEIGFPVGGILASLLYAAIYSNGGWRPMFYIAAIPGIILGIYALFTLRESKAWLEKRKQEQGINKIPIINLFSGRQLWDTVHSILVNTGFLVLYYSIAAWYPTFLKEQHHFSVGMVSLITILLNLAAAIGSIVFGFWSDKIGRRWTITISAVGSMLGAPLFVILHNTGLLVIGAVIIGFFGPGGVWSVNASYTAEHFPLSMRSAGHGLTYNGGNFLGGMLTPVIIGLLSVQYGFGVLMTVGVLSSAVFLIIMTWIWRETRDMDMSL
ncbi:Sugar transporter [Acididesulfobacillus acetoxydans]|uniref:Cis,cis-muconate transport protein n=1 Tax=Acididesulfobacillus acetoxydans TaxID=1561005 RepID=A0A8S0WNC6_9FIRM|nr:MFS transporter [Acididesulfobacillus acetoxydans]CAA7601234.1 Sugar transporter [Acididesulfobacillus acetoxydans]CEJ08487.1 Cis,cis-muconate transport protein [Acididesulfobacillus acetoxydans]